MQVVSDCFISGMGRHTFGKPIYFIKIIHLIKPTYSSIIASICKHIASNNTFVKTWDNTLCSLKTTTFPLQKQKHRFLVKNTKANFRIFVSWKLQSHKSEMVSQFQKGPRRILDSTEECSSSVKASSKLTVLEGSADHTHTVYMLVSCAHLGYQMKILLFCLRQILASSVKF